MKLSDITGLRPDPRSNDTSDRLVSNNVYVGIEIEVEGMRDYQACPLPHDTFWQVKQDGSLRDDGLEFITGVSLNNMVHPIRGKDLVDTLDVWKTWIEKYYKEIGKYPSLTHRTSDHIHIDVRDLSKEELDRFILLWAIFESTFFHIVGRERIDNIHCKPFFKNIRAKRRVSEMLKTSSRNEVLSILQHSSKYEAMNIASVPTFGSVEFRIHEGSINSDDILEWINILLSLRNAAKDPTISLVELPEMASGNGMIKFVEKVFKEYAKAILPIITDEMFFFGVRQAQEIIHSHDMARQNSLFSSQEYGKKANEESILHKWAAVNNRKIY